MAEFLGFGQLTRPDIGLIADGVQNLAEIYTSDQPTALRNIRLAPEVLDIIYNLSKTISREDLRAVSGLSSLLLSTLDLQDETFERINDILYIQERYVSSSKQIGIDANPSLRGDLVKVPNVIVYNGSIQCQGVQYRTKVLGETSLYSGGENRLTSVSTSRASLFNSEKFGNNEENTGYFKSASYPSLIRVRRRSHLNRIVVNKSTFIPRAPVKENPSHEILCHVDNGNTGISQPLKLLATKNSPLRIPCRMASGKITFTFTETGVFFFGYQVQPLQSRTLGEKPQFLPLPPKSQLIASNSFTLDIDITTTGYQNSYDLYLYLYLNPEKIRSIEISGINVSEFVDGKDIGLVGFNNLTSLRLSGTSIKILPIWLKTLNTKLQVLDLASDGDTYRTSILKYFDYRNATESPTSSTPLYTVTSYLSIPKKGAIINEEGTDWNDTLFENYIKSQVPTLTSRNDPSVVARTANTDFRQFGAMRVLNLGDRFLGVNPRLDDVFPGLTELLWRGYVGRGIWPISGTPPKINNNGNVFSSYNIHTSGVSGNITDIGTSITIGDNTINGPTHISKYKIDAIDVAGEYDYGKQNISGSIATSNFSEWATWFTQTKSINISWSYVSIGLQPTGYVWQNLQGLSTEYSGGIVFTPAVGTVADPIKAPNIAGLSVYGTSSTGPIPSLGTDPTQHTAAITYVQFGGTNTISTVSENGYPYILPSNFAPDRPSSPHRLNTFAINDTSRVGRFRANDFKYLYELNRLDLRRSPGLWGKFPIFPTKKNPETETKNISIDIAEGCRFSDLSTLDITPSNRYIARDLISLDAWNQNIARGGCKLPSLEGIGGVDATRVEYIHLGNSLTSTYPSNWTGTNKSPGSYIFEKDIIKNLSNVTKVDNGNVSYLTGDSGTTLDTTGLSFGDEVHTSYGELTEVAKITSVSSNRLDLDRKLPSGSNVFFYIKRPQPYSVINAITPNRQINSDDAIYFMTGATDFDRKVLVNDSVHSSTTGAELARVVSVESNTIYLDRDIPGSSAETYFFKRNTQSINTWFQNGFTNLLRLRLHGCRLSGSINIRSGFGKIVDDNYPALDLSNNCLTGYTAGFNRIFSGSNRKITIDLSYNNFTTSVVRSMLNELLDIEAQRVFTNVEIRLNNTKLSTSDTYINYSQEELFPTAIQSASNQTISLTRTERVKIYSEVTTTDANGITTTTKIVTGSKNITVPGAFIPSLNGYYKTQTNGRQQIVENSLGIKLKGNRNWRILLGFTYQSPDTSPTVTGTTYSNPTTREASLAELGYTLADLA